MDVTSSCRPRGVLGVARATVQSGLDRMSEAGVISLRVLRPDPARFGFPIIDFCSLTINLYLDRAPRVVRDGPQHPYPGQDADMFEAAAAGQPE